MDGQDSTHFSRLYRSLCTCCIAGAILQTWASPETTERVLSPNMVVSVSFLVNLIFAYIRTQQHARDHDYLSKFLLSVHIGCLVTVWIQQSLLMPTTFATGEIIKLKYTLKKIFSHTNIFMAVVITQFLFGFPVTHEERYAGDSTEEGSAEDHYDPLEDEAEL